MVTRLNIILREWYKLDEIKIANKKINRRPIVTLRSFNKIFNVETLKHCR